MSYIVIEVYSFACDGKLDGRDCPHSFECIPANMAGSGTLLDEAHRQLRADGWQVVGRGLARRHYCGLHAASAHPA